MSAAAASMRITLFTQITQANVVITQSSVRPSESGKGTLAKGVADAASWHPRGCVRDSAEGYPCDWCGIVGSSAAHGCNSRPKHDIQIALDD